MSTTNRAVVVLDNMWRMMRTRVCCSDFSPSAIFEVTPGGENHAGTRKAMALAEAEGRMRCAWISLKHSTRLKMRNPSRWGERTRRRDGWLLDCILATNLLSERCALMGGSHNRDQSRQPIRAAQRTANQMPASDLNIFRSLNCGYHPLRIIN